MYIHLIMILKKGFEQKKNQTDIYILLVFERVKSYIIGKVVNKNDKVFEIVC